MPFIRFYPEFDKLHFTDVEARAPVPARAHVLASGVLLELEQERMMKKQVMPPLLVMPLISMVSS